MSIRNAIPERFQTLAEKLGVMRSRRVFQAKNGNLVVDPLKGKTSTRYSGAPAFAFDVIANFNLSPCIRIGGMGGDPTLFRFSLIDAHDENDELTPLAISILNAIDNMLAVESRSSKNYALTFYGFDPDLPDLLEIWRPKRDSGFTDGTRLEIHMPSLCHLQRLPTDENLLHGNMDRPCNWQDISLILARHGANQFTECRPWEGYIQDSMIRNQQEIFV